MKKSLLAASIIAFCGLALWGCATVPVTRVAIRPGSGPLFMRAWSFGFAPNEVTVEGTGTLALEVENTSGILHNITIDDPRGERVESVALPPHTTTMTSVDFTAPGSYPFFCDHLFHAELGMKGRFIVEGG